MTYSYMKLERHQTLIHFIYDWSNNHNITSKIINAVIYYFKLEQMAALDDIMMVLMFCQIISESIKVANIVLMFYLLYTCYVM